MDVAARRLGHAGRAGRTSWTGCHRPRRQQQLGAGRHSRRRPLLPVLLGAGHSAQGGHRPADRQDARSQFAGLQVGGWRSGRLVRRRRRQQRDRSGRASRSDERNPVADLRLVLRLHPARRTGSENREAAASRTEANQHRDQLRSVHHDLSRGLVLPAGHARVVLRRRRIPATTSAWADRRR